MRFRCWCSRARPRVGGRGGCGSPGAGKSGSGKGGRGTSPGVSPGSGDGSGRGMSGSGRGGSSCGGTTSGGRGAGVTGCGSSAPQFAVFSIEPALGRIGLPLPRGGSPRLGNARRARRFRPRANATRRASRCGGERIRPRRSRPSGRAGASIGSRSRLRSFACGHAGARGRPDGEVAHPIRFALQNSRNWSIIRGNPTARPQISDVVAVLGSA